MSKPAKILVFGPVNGKFNEFAQKATSFNRKNGPFDSILVAGDFFGSNNEDSEYDEQLDKLLKDEISFPISTIVIGGKNPIHAKVAKKVDIINGGDICSNLFYLGKSGIFQTSEGVKIAFLSGIEREDTTGTDTNTSTSTDSANSPTTAYFSSQDVHNLIALSKNSLPNIKYDRDEDFISLVDILLTCPWPSRIQTGTEVLPANTPAHQSQLVANLCYQLKPRYHFASQEATFYERSPFEYKPHMRIGNAGRSKNPGANSAAHFTRFIGLGEFGASSRWYYAMNVTPLHVMNIQPEFLGAVPQNLTKCPFVAESNKRFIDEVNSVRYNNSETSQLKKPPSSYICVICKQGGHFVKECPLKSQQRGLKKMRDDRSKAQCWFCLSSPDIDKHLLVDIGEKVYIALAKGGLNYSTTSSSTTKPDLNANSSLQTTVPAFESHSEASIAVDVDVDVSSFLVPGGGHVLIIPIDHISTSIDDISSDAADSNIASVNSEYLEYRGKITRVFEKFGCVPVSFQLIRKTNYQHTFVPLIAVPKQFLPVIRQKFIEYAESENIKWSNELPDKSAFGYHKIDLSDGQPPLVYHLQKDKRVDIQVGRKILAQVMGIASGEDWKSCTLPGNIESIMTKQFATELRKV